MMMTMMFMMVVIGDDYDYGRCDDDDDVSNGDDDEYAHDGDDDNFDDDGGDENDDVCDGVMMMMMMMWQVDLSLITFYAQNAPCRFQPHF
jgi:hypothetical protein